MTRVNGKPNATNETRRINSFFAGIGGFDLAFEREGFSSAFFCENNAFCRSVLKKHWPEVINACDIQQLNAKDIPLACVWTAGFPCQDLSLARTPHGKRNGLKGLQSGLFFTFLDLLSSHKPPVVLLENVAGLLSSHGGADFKVLVSSLTKLGYAVAWRVLNARHFGAPQSRPRVFICAWLGSPSKAVNALFEDQIATKPKNERSGFMVESKCAVSRISVPQVSFCISATSGRHTGLDWARSYVTYPNAVRRLTPLECERLQGLPDNWTKPDKDYVVPIRGIETNRYHAIGNAVCIPVVQWVASRISSNLQLSNEVEGSPKKSPIKKQIQHLADTFLSTGSEVRKLSDDTQELKWKSGGIAYRDYFITVAVSSSPVIISTSKLIDVIERTKVHNRYFLSTNAVEGILRRVDNLGRHLFPPLDAVLRKINAPNSTKKIDLDENHLDKKFITS
jgi:DNA (cytosine-5)-methyltransferase 1